MANLIFVREYSVENFKQMVNAPSVDVIPMVKRDSEGNVVRDKEGKATFCDIKEGKFFFSFGKDVDQSKWVYDEKGNVKDRVGKVANQIDFNKEVVISLCVNPSKPNDYFFLMHNKGQRNITIVKSF